MKAADYWRAELGLGTGLVMSGASLRCLAMSLGPRAGVGQLVDGSLVGVFRGLVPPTGGQGWVLGSLILVRARGRWGHVPVCLPAQAGEFWSECQPTGGQS